MLSGCLGLVWFRINEQLGLGLELGQSARSGFELDQVVVRSQTQSESSLRIFGDLTSSFWTFSTVTIFVKRDVGSGFNNRELGRFDRNRVGLCSFGNISQQL